MCFKRIASQDGRVRLVLGQSVWNDIGENDGSTSRYKIQYFIAEIENMC